MAEIASIWWTLPWRTCLETTRVRKLCFDLFHVFFHRRNHLFGLQDVGLWNMMNNKWQSSVGSSASSAPPIEVPHISSPGLQILCDVCEGWVAPTNQLGLRSAAFSGLIVSLNTQMLLMGWGTLCARGSKTGWRRLVLRSEPPTARVAAAQNAPKVAN